MKTAASRILAVFLALLPALVGRHLGLEQLDGEGAAPVGHRPTASR